MKPKFKIIKQKKLPDYLIMHNGKLVNNSYDVNSTYYECDNNILVIVNNLVNIATVYFDRESVYKEQEKIRKWKDFKPYQDQQQIIQNVNQERMLLINQLFKELNLQKPSQLSDVNLKTFDITLKRYGVDNAIRKLYVNLIVFCGEYIREKNGGSWSIMRSMSDPKIYYPIFVDSNSRNYEFEINTLLLKTFYEKASISIEKILRYAELPVAGIETNPDNQ